MRLSLDHGDYTMPDFPNENGYPNFEGFSACRVRCQMEMPLCDLNDWQDSFAEAGFTPAGYWQPCAEGCGLPYTGAHPSSKYFVPAEADPVDPARAAEAAEDPEAAAAMRQQPQTKQGARAVCAAQGARLATVNSETDSWYLSTLGAKIEDAQSLWLPASLNAQGHFVQADGSDYGSALNAEDFDGSLGFLESAFAKCGENCTVEVVEGADGRTQCMVQDITTGEWLQIPCEDVNNYVCENCRFTYIGEGYCRAVDCYDCPPAHDHTNFCVRDMAECIDRCQGHYECVGFAFAANPTFGSSDCAYGRYAPRCVLYWAGGPAIMGSAEKYDDYECYSMTPPTPVVPGDPEEMLGQVCYNQCQGGGDCPNYCGAGLACCQSGSPFPEPGCESYTGCAGYHCCVPSSNGAPPAPGPAPSPGPPNEGRPADESMCYPTCWDATDPWCTEDSCELWALQGECVSNAEWMWSMCCEECFEWEEDQLEMQSEIQQALNQCAPTCTMYPDMDCSPSQCMQWASTGQCYVNPDFMFGMCCSECVNMGFLPDNLRSYGGAKAIGFGFHSTSEPFSRSPGQFVQDRVDPRRYGNIRLQNPHDVDISGIWQRTPVTPANIRENADPAGCLEGEECEGATRVEDTDRKGFFRENVVLIALWLVPVLLLLLGAVFIVSCIVAKGVQKNNAPKVSLGEYVRMDLAPDPIPDAHFCTLDRMHKMHSSTGSSRLHVTRL